MSNLPVLFFDGNRAHPRMAAIEVSDDAIYLFDEEGDANNTLAFPLARCSSSLLGEKMFIYLEGGAGPCIEIHESHPLFKTLSNTLNAQNRGWFNKLFKQKWQVLVLILGGLIITLYLLLAVLLPFILIKSISVQREIVLGEKIYESVVSGSRIDSSASRTAQAFAGQLHLSEKYPIRVTVVKSTDVNAFALPGGHIVIYTGLLELLQSPEELVALMGHEVTHVNKRHSLQGLLSGISLSLLKSILLSGGIGDFVFSNAGTLQELSYSRKREREADREGMLLMLKNHINPAGMEKLMERLESKSGNFLSFSFISTHPLTEERIQSAETFARSYKAVDFKTPMPLENLWKQLKNK